MPRVIFQGGPLDGTEATFDSEIQRFHVVGVSNKMQVGAGGAAVTVGADHKYKLTGADALGRLVYEYAGGEG